MKRTFLNQPQPIATGIFCGQTPKELIAEAKNCEFEGADGLAIDLHDLLPEFRNRDSFKSIVDAVNLPFMFCFYRNDAHQNLDDDGRQEVLLQAAEAGGSIIDVMGDLYDPSPMEITHNPAAIDKQKRLIDRIHAIGADVVISSHIQCPRTAEQVFEHLSEVAKRGADVVKIVTTVNTDEELSEAFRTTLLLKRELKKPFIHLCGGTYSRPHRFLGPALGVSIFFCVSHYEPRYNMPQPTIRAMKSVLRNLHWNINNL